MTMRHIAWKKLARTKSMQFSGHTRGQIGHEVCYDAVYIPEVIKIDSTHIFVSCSGGCLIPETRFQYSCKDRKYFGGNGNKYYFQVKKRDIIRRSR
jgi:hypothetical protein